MPMMLTKLWLKIIFWSIFTPEGHPSTIPPIAKPCDSPKVVRVKRLPNLFPATLLFYANIRFIDRL